MQRNKLGGRSGRPWIIAVLAAIAGMTAPAAAQTLPSNQSLPYTLNLSGQSGNTGPDQSEQGGPGTQGFSGGSISVQIPSPVTWISPSSAGAAPTISLISSGGNGGSGGNATCNTCTYGNGGAGAPGGDGATSIMLTVGSFSEPNQIALTNQGTGPVLQLIANGGAGGSGGIPADHGTGGAAGTAGNAGGITLYVNSGTTLTSSGAGITAIDLEAIGGNGGNGGENTVTWFKSAQGPDGTGGGAGGLIQAQITGSTINSAGSGIIANSPGGAGGNGASAGSVAGSGHGGSGGAGGANGGVVLQIDSTSITAVGAAAAGTGGTITVDATNNGTTTALASIMSAAVGGFSYGAGGGYGDYANSGVGASGGLGGNGGPGGTVQIGVDQGSLKTTGYGAAGIVAVSGGAGGGAGGEAGAIFSRKGGTGGAGGDGGITFITLTDGATVTTKGRLSDGALAVSVGGGGGLGGDVEGGGIGMSIAFGGNGGAGGNGGPAGTLPGNAPISDAAKVSNGIYLSSLGFTPGGVVSTTGTNSLGLAAISVGGGGGRGGDANTADAGILAFPIGGNGGTGGTGAAAEVDNYGVVQTAGLHGVGLDAQSVGGGGGAGGAAHAYNIGVNTLALSAAAAVGGTGGTCSATAGCPTGGPATVLNYGQVITMGGDAHGILAQSIGGGGGSGGASVADNLMVNLTPADTPTVQVTAAIGGSGGSGGDGKTVGVLNSGMIITQGVGAHGILAQSIGGGGGNGGDSTATSKSITPSSLTINVSLGGGAGNGGGGGTVNVYNSGLIWTLNGQAPGISAESIGNGGGTGGYGKASTGKYSNSSQEGMSVTLQLGGAGGGGSGGDGGSVNVYNYVTAANTPDQTGYGAAGIGSGGIVTMGDSSDGIYAHSVGGGGGNGGNATANGGGGNVSVTVQLGGSGGAAGNGQSVLVDNGTGAIATYGGQSAGIFAQSVGGGGGRGGTAGNSGSADPNYTVNTFMQQGLGLGGTATNVVDNVWKWGGQIVGAFNQVSTLNTMSSTYGTDNLSGYQPDAAQSSSSNMSLQLGGGFSGKGGSGGNGGTVTVLNAGPIQTAGPLSPAIFAQSIGGGGGLGGASNPAMDQAHLSSSSAKFSLSLGGSGGGSGAGNTVTVTDTGTITTQGDVSPGILAQSVGGGGGNGAVTIMSGTTGSLGTVVLGVDANSSQTNKPDSGPIAWNSLNGGAVTVTTSTVQTSGNDSPGVLAQSVGGGGGIAVVTSAAYNAQTGGWTSATQNLAANNPQSVGFGFMGNAPAGSWAGVVTVNLNPTSTGQYGTITTSGINSYGILAQAVGNGGGIAITDYAPTATAAFTNPGLGTSNSNGAAVNVNVNGPSVITTTGAGAVGILAQSVSGGGIVGGMNGVALQLSQVNAEAQSYGGTVTVNNSADIHVSGAYAHGIFAQSTSLGGIFGQPAGQTGTLAAASSAGSCGSTCADNGQVTVNLNGGTIYVHGADAYGVVMVSQGNPTGTNNTTLNVNSGGRIATDLQSAGAVFIGGADANLVTVNPGGIVNANAAGLAFATWATNPASAKIENNGGLIYGSTVLGDGATLTNAAGGRIEAGPVIQLGPHGSVTNNATLSIGYGRSIATTTLTGNFLQGAAGKLEVDTDHADRQADRLAIQGSAELGGTIEVHPINLTNAPVTVLSATGGVSLDAGLTSTRTLLFNFAPVSDGSTVQIRPQADFRNMFGGGGPLSDTQSRVANHLQAIWDSGSAMGGGFSTLFAGVNDPAGYARTLNSLSGQTLGAISAFRFASSRSFISNLYSCPTYTPGSMLSAESDCTWMRVLGNQTSQDSTAGSLGYSASSVTTQIAGQKQFAPNWFFGASLAYERSRFGGEQGTSQATGDGMLAGALVKYENGPWLVSGGVDAGYGWYSASRLVSVGNVFSAVAKANPTSWHVGVNSRIAYQIPFETWYLKPGIDLHAAYVGSGGYTESGAAPFNLAVQSASSVAVAATAAIEVGTLVDLGRIGMLRPFASAGIGALSTDGWAATAHFASAQDGSSFRASTPLPAVVGRFTAGADLYATGNWSFKLQYSGDVANGYQSHTGSGRIAWSF